jgi:thymidylate kinase
MMFTVALVGGDGAGKTTIAKSLEQDSPLPVRYLHMGVSAQSGNLALPTSRLVLLLKRRSYRRMVLKSGGTPSEHIPARHLEYAQTKRGPIWLVGRFLNRLAEAWYRQVVSLSYQLRGYVVVYDRHFFFDTVPLVIDPNVQEEQRLDSLYYWILSHLYPKPHLTVFLDAPAEVLYERKGEATPDYLNRQREAFLEQGKKLANFVRVNATQPPGKVLEDVTRHIMEFHASRASVDG